MLGSITIAQRLWCWALLASVLFFSAVGLGWYGLQQASDSLRTVLPRPGMLSASPSDSSCASAARAVLRLTLKSSVITVSNSRWPGA